MGARREKGKLRYIYLQARQHSQPQIIVDPFISYIQDFFTLFFTVLLVFLSSYWDHSLSVKSVYGTDFFSIFQPSSPYLHLFILHLPSESLFLNLAYTFNLDGTKNLNSLGPSPKIFRIVVLFPAFRNRIQIGQGKNVETNSMFEKPEWPS